MESTTFAPSDGARPSGAPFVSAAQASALLRSGLAIASELIGNAFGSVCSGVQEGLTGRWDFDVGSPLVQRLLAYKQTDLQQAFLRRLKDRQDVALDQVLARHTAASTGNLQLSAETLSLVDAVTASNSTVVDRSAG